MSDNHIIKPSRAFLLNCLLNGISTAFKKNDIHEFATMLAEYINEFNSNLHAKFDREDSCIICEDNEGYLISSIDLFPEIIKFKSFISETEMLDNQSDDLASVVLATILFSDYWHKEFLKKSIAPASGLEFSKHKEVIHTWEDDGFAII